MEQAEHHYTVIEAKRETLRQTERIIEAQHAYAAASDQRAVQFCAALGVIITILAQANGDSDNARVLQLEALVTMLGAALMAAYSARPVHLYPSGGPSAIFSDYFHPEYSERLLVALCARNDKAFRENDREIRRNANIFRNSMVVAAIGVGTMILSFALDIGFSAEGHT